MSSPPSAPKQKRGPRKLLEPFNISHSRSPRQSLNQADSSLSSTATRSEGNAGLITNPGIGSLHVDNDTTGSSRTSSASIDPHEQTSVMPRPSTIIDPIDTRQEFGMHIETAATNSPSTLAPVDSLLDTVNASSGALFATQYASTKAELDPPIDIPSIQAQRSENIVWSRLRESIGYLKERSSVFSPFIPAVGPLLSCLDGLEEALQSHEDLNNLATELTEMARSLAQHTDGLSSIFLSDSTARLAMAIEMEVKAIQEILSRALDQGTLEAEIDGELIRHFRQIHSHFRQLQIDTRMSTWSITNEQSTSTKLESLNPAKQATYDSGLSTQINRRGCTEGTRIGVLNALDNWLNDPTSSFIYWMNGMAGTGKTTIASTFCERVEERKFLAASFFCTRNSAECRDTTRMVPTIAYQLAQYSIPFQSALCQALEQNTDAGSKNVLKQFEQLLKGPLLRVKDAVPDKLVVVIDALDECDDRNEVELILDMLFRHAADLPLKFLITSRPEPEIYTKMLAYTQSQQVVHLHDIESSLVQADIALYLSEELGSIFSGQAEIEQLTQHSGTLFIYAATLVRYISGKRSADPHKRLKTVLEMAPGSTKKHTQIDALYETVLKAALSEDEPDRNQTDDIWAVLHVVLLAQEPIGVETIAKLADIDDQERVVRAVQPLRSVLHQSPKNGLVSTLHASFTDFMFTYERSGAYFCDVRKHSELLAQRSFLLMKDQLRFNVCGLESSSLPDEKVSNMEERIKGNISPTLAYVCRYWASHLASAAELDVLLTMLGEFLCHRLLFWMEVLSLRRELPMAVDGLLRAQQWLMYSGYSSSEIVLFLDDARSFVTRFAVNPVSQCTPHIYISALPFCPQSSLVYKHYYKRAHGLLELRGSLMERREAAPLATWISGSEILALALSPDGTRVAIGCLNKTVSVLSAYDGTIHVGPLEGHANSISSIVFSSDGKLIASASLGTFRVWNALNGTLIAGPFVGHMRQVNSVSFSPDSRHVVTGGHDCTIRVWDIYKRTLVLGPLTGDDNREGFVLRVAFSPNGDLIASASADKTVRLWKSQDGTPATLPFRGHTGRVECLAFTPDGTRIVTGSSDNTILVWDVSDGSIINSKFENCIGGINSLAVSYDSTRIAAGSNDLAVRVWKINDGTLVAGPFFSHTDSIKSVAYSPDGTRVFSGSSDKCIHVWNVRDGNFPPPPLPPQRAVTAIRSMSFCSDNKHVLSSDVHSVIRTWDISDGSYTTLPVEGNFFPVALTMLSQDGSYIAGTSKDGRIQIMSTLDGSLVAGPFEVERTSLSAFWFSHNNKAIIMGCKDGTIKVCDLENGKAIVGSFKSHPRGVSSLTESPDCSTLVSYSDYENVIRIWSITTPTLDLGLFNTSICSTSVSRYSAVYDGWDIREDGWAVNNNEHLLFWLPPDVASAWCSPYATLVLTNYGTLQVPKQKPLIGEQWAKCYIPE